MKLTFPPALRSYKFSLLLSGLFISRIGSRMQFFALLWHIKQIVPDDPIYLGLIGLTRVIPIIIFSLISGVTADTYNRKNILYITQTVQTGVAIGLAWLTFTGNVQLWHLYVLTAIEAISISFDTPARHALTPNLVPTKHLPNAFSLQSMVFTVASTAGPAMAGLIMATSLTGLANVYWINAISYIAIFIALIMMGSVPQTIAKNAKFDWSAIGDGIKFIKGARLIHSSMILDFIATFFSSATALLPVYVDDVLDMNKLGAAVLWLAERADAELKPFIYGLLGSAQSAGAGLTAFILSLLPDMRKQGRILLWMVVAYGVATIMFGFSTIFWVSFIALALVGATDTVSMVIRNTIRQLQTPDQLRGRMTSINQIFFMGGPQLGEMEAGTIAQFFGPVIAVVSGGIGCIMGVAWIANKWPELRDYNGDEDTLAGQGA